MKDPLKHGTRYDLESVITQLFPSLSFEPVELLIELLLTSHEVYHEMTIKLYQYGLSQGKIKILLSLLKHDRALNPSELADYVGVTRSTVTGLIDGLEQDELIRRGFLDDRRKIAIHLTEKGKQLMKTVIPIYVAHTTKIISVMTKEEQEFLTGVLRKIRVGLDQLKQHP